MFAKDINVKVSDIPAGWSLEAADFINKLLRRKSKDRLGKGGITELKEHAWLRGIQWQDIYKKEVQTPYIPKEGDNFDEKYCNRQDPVDKQTYDYYLHKINVENYFQKFYYNYYDEKSKDPHFELDGVGYKFYNLHDENYSLNKVESSVSRNIKSSLGGSTAMNTPRMEPHSSMNQTYFNQSNISHRKLFAG
jgi:hypothetical protein